MIRWCKTEGRMGSSPACQCLHSNRWAPVLIMFIKRNKIRDMLVQVPWRQSKSICSSYSSINKGRWRPMEGYLHPDNTHSWQVLVSTHLEKLLKECSRKIWVTSWPSMSKRSKNHQLQSHRWSWKQESSMKTRADLMTSGNHLSDSKNHLADSCLNCQVRFAAHR